MNPLHSHPRALAATHRAINVLTYFLRTSAHFHVAQVMPGQALAYKVGEIDILRLKDQAQRELGDRFTWKGFHDALLNSGCTFTHTHSLQRTIA